MNVICSTRTERVRVSVFVVSRQIIIPENTDRVESGE